MTDQTANTENPLTLYNSLTRTKERFVPQDPKRVTMYNCGPTVYSYAHIGNARAAVVADVLFRVLRHIYGEDHVVYARNITDVDDKIIAAAKEQGVDISEITEKYARIYNEDLAALGCLPPTHQPKATDNIDEMVDIIIELLEKDIAYISEGQILFDVTKKDDYGKLSGRKIEDNLAGARVDVASYKRNPNDFLLWKVVEDNDPYGIPAPLLTKYSDENWRRHSNHPIELSPGRPGWHIECSAMVRKVLGETIDIHCGGVDLKFPHHENEIAQSECANGKQFSRFWVHNEFLNMGSEKMSKSLGNVKLIHDLTKKWDGEVIRLALLKAHYRSELIWSENLLEESKTQLDGWYRSLKIFKSLSPISGQTRVKERLNTATLDDLNIPATLSSLNDFGDFARAEYENVPDEVKLENADWNLFVDLHLLTTQLRLLGLLQKDPEDWFSGGLDKDKYDALVADYDTARAEAVAAKQAGDKALMGQLFARSDEIRDQLKAEGVVLETGPEGSSWRKA